MRSAWLLSVLLMLAGCAALSWQRPHLALQSVSVLGGNLMTQKLRVVLQVSNPNARALELEAVSFEILCGHLRCANASSRDVQRIAPESESALAFELRVSLLELLQNLPVEMRNGRLPYQINGEAQIKGLGRMPFEQTGELDLVRTAGTREKKESAAP